jgi:site-specific DNA-methyltransferase (adenine-specific)
MKIIKNIGDVLNQIINGDCVEVMSKLPENTIDLIVTSPPYSVNIDYDVYNDNTTLSEYIDFSKKWLSQSFRVLKDDGRICVNVPYEINLKDRGGRVFIVAELWKCMEEIGFKWFGLVDLDEQSPHRSKTTAWGSWMSPSQPYIYNPKECIIIAYKNSPNKKIKGTPQWIGESGQVADKDNPALFRNKTIYKDEDKREFMELVYGQWKYFADTKQQTKATFSMDIPTKAIKILTYKNDIVLDPFAGSGTSLVAAEILDRRWIGIELSPNYTEVANNRVKPFVEGKRQQVMDFNEKEGH